MHYGPGTLLPIPEYLYYMTFSLIDLKGIFYKKSTFFLLNLNFITGPDKNNLQYSQLSLLRAEPFLKICPRKTNPLSIIDYDY
jgi:hypothetical protein